MLWAGIIVTGFTVVQFSQQKMFQTLNNLIGCLWHTLQDIITFKFKPVSDPINKISRVKWGMLHYFGALWLAKKKFENKIKFKPCKKNAYAS